jgi:hypothetical protein
MQSRVVETIASVDSTLGEASRTCRWAIAGFQASHVDAESDALENPSVGIHRKEIRAYF